jgi:hypothetical protein
MRFLIDFIAFIVLQNVGAFVKWAFTGFKRPWKEIIAGNPYYNQWLGAFSFSVGVVIVLVTIKYFHGK